MSEVELLGHIVDRTGWHSDPKKVDAIVKMPPPTNVKEIQIFLGLLGWQRRFMKDFASIAKPITNLLKKDMKFQWGREQQEAAAILKQKLVEYPYLFHFDESAPLEVHSDASNKGLGCVLYQKIGEELQSIAYASRTLTPAEQNYTTSETAC